MSSRIFFQLAGVAHLLEALGFNHGVRLSQRRQRFRFFLFRPQRLNTCLAPLLEMVPSAMRVISAASRSALMGLSSMLCS